MIIICDIDGVMADESWRNHLIDGTGEGWDNYHGASIDDAAVGFIRDMINRSNKPVVACTGRPEKWRGMTNGWMIREGFLVHVLLMRPDDDFRKAPIAKLDMICKHLNCKPEELKDHVYYAIDDRDDILAVYRSYGVPTMLVTLR